MHYCSGQLLFTYDLFRLPALSRVTYRDHFARRGGTEVAGKTLDLNSPLTLTACGPSDGKEVKDVFGRPGARVDVGSAR